MKVTQEEFFAFLNNPILWAGEDELKLEYHTSEYGTPEERKIHDARSHGDFVAQRIHRRGTEWTHYFVYFPTFHLLGALSDARDLRLTMERRYALKGGTDFHGAPPLPIEPWMMPHEENEVRRASGNLRHARAMPSTSSRRLFAFSAGSRITTKAELPSSGISGPFSGRWRLRYGWGRSARRQLQHRKYTIASTIPER